MGATEVRIAGILGGLPKEVPVMTVNRQCSSGLQAMANVAGAIKVRMQEPTNYLLLAPSCDSRWANRSCRVASTILVSPEALRT